MRPNYLPFPARLVLQQLVTRTACVVLQASLPYHQEHSNTLLCMEGGPEEIQRLYAQWAMDFWLHTLREGAASLCSLEVLHECQLTTGRAHVFQGPHDEHAHLQAQLENSLANKLFTLTRLLMRNRICSMAWHSLGFPGLWASLLHDEEAARHEGLRRMKWLQELLDAGSACQMPFLTRKLKENIWNAPAVQEVTLELRKAQWQLHLRRAGKHCHS